VHGKNIDELALDVLNLARNTLAIHLRFMDKAIGMLKLQAVPGLNGVAVDGVYIYYDSMSVLRCFSKERNEMTREYLHMILHCVYQHFWVSTTVNQRLWDLACDIAVERTIHDMALPPVETSIVSAQEQAFLHFEENVKYMTADVIYKYLMNAELDYDEICGLEKLFSADLHTIWYRPKEQGLQSIADSERTNNPSMLPQESQADDSHEDEESARDEAADQKEQNDDTSADGQLSNDSDASPSNKCDGDKGVPKAWKSVARQMKIDLETFSKSRGDQAGSLTLNLRAVTRERYDYAEFLRKFAVLNEAMKINDDEFDYIFYTYGMNLYGNMPLIEPLEYKDMKQIREFVIAIDTSGSTRGELVQRFVNKTYNILKQEESFSNRFNLHIIQCDCEVHQDFKITSQDEFDSYMRNMRIYGGGGTDFRPVFDHVDELIANGELLNLKGMIYFTDGQGLFPFHSPQYHVAIVYIDDPNNDLAVPPWAIKLVLQPEDI